MSNTTTSLTDSDNLNIIVAKVGTNQNFSSDPTIPHDPTKISVVSYQDSGTSVDASLQGQFAPYGEAVGDIFGDKINGLIGTSRGDWLGGNANANYLNGGAGNDTLWGGAGADTLEGGEGSWDRASYSESAIGLTVNLGGLHGIASTGEATGDVFNSIEGIIGSKYDDILIANHNGIGLEGGFGSDTLIGGAGADWFYGSFETDQTDTGIDVVSYEYASSAIAFDMTYSITSVGEAAGDRFTSIEHVIGSRFNDTMGGTDYADILEGGQGNDVLAGHSGGDVLRGGAGYDFASYSRSEAAVQVDLKRAADYETQTGGHAEGDLLIGIEGIIGSRYADILKGDGLDNTFDAWLGADTMTGGKGNDTYHVNERGDLVTEEAGEGTDTVITEIDYTLGANVENLTAKAGYSTAIHLNGNALNNVITGNEFANVINGGAGADTINGGAGDDTIMGGAGADVMMGGDGDDTYYVDDAGDVIVDTSGYDTVYLSANIALSPAIENVIAVGTAAIALTGDASRNVFTGNDGNNKINGGLGNDVLAGGGGQDTFVFNTKIGTYKTNKNMNFDTILDFNPKDDAIYLDNAIFKKLGKKGSEASPAKLNKKFFKVGTKASDKDDYLVYNKKKGVLYYDADGKGKGKAVEIMKFENKAKLTAADFFVI